MSEGEIHMEFLNVYQDRRRASAYDELGYGGTYRLVFDALPAVLERHVAGLNAMDFGCGTGRTLRYLRGLGFSVVGVDISAEMVERARRQDPSGDYRVIADGDFSSLPNHCSDLVLSAFTFDNVSEIDAKVGLFRGLRNLLATGGRLINIVSTPEIYLNEWVTFSTRDFPENRNARPGDVVRIITTDYSDARPVDDILCPDAEYQQIYQQSGLAVLEHLKPLARDDDEVSWQAETRIAPWSIYVLEKAGSPACRGSGGSCT